MTLLDEMTLYWSKQVSSDIANETILSLESKKDLFYNNENCLNSDWEGFCVQVQEKVSIIDLDACVDMIDSFFKRYYDVLPKEEQFTLWLQTQEGQVWVSQVDNTHSDTFDYDVAPVDFPACEKLLMAVLMEMAIDFKSDSITRYINYAIHGIEEEEEDFEEEEEEYEE